MGFRPWHLSSKEAPPPNSPRKGERNKWDAFNPGLAPAVFCFFFYKEIIREYKGLMICYWKNISSCIAPGSDREASQKVLAYM